MYFSNMYFSEMHVSYRNTFFKEHFCMAASNPSTYFSGPTLGKSLWKEVKLWIVREIFKNTYEGPHVEKNWLIGAVV